MTVKWQIIASRKGRGAISDTYRIATIPYPLGKKAARACAQAAKQ